MEKFLSMSFDELERLYQSGKLSEDEVRIFQDDYFYFLYIQKHYPEFNFAVFENLPEEYESWQKFLKKLLKYNQITERLKRDRSLPKDIRLIYLKMLEPEQILAYCKENSSEPLCSDEFSELWKDLYHKFVSAYPPRFDEMIDVKFQQGEDEYIAFFKENSIYYLEPHNFMRNRVSYKQLYLIWREVKEDIISKIKLGSEIAFEGVTLNDDNIISAFIAAITNNHMHLVQLILPRYLDVATENNFFMNRLYISFLLERGFYDMTLYLHKLDIGFVYDYNRHKRLLIEYYNIDDPIKSELFVFIVKNLLTQLNKYYLFRSLLDIEPFRQDKMDLVLESIELTPIQKSDIFTIAPINLEKYRFLVDAIKPDPEILNKLILRLRQRGKYLYSSGKNAGAKEILDMMNFLSSHL